MLSDIEENNFLLPVKALRDEERSYHYKAHSRFIDINPIVLEDIEATLKDCGLKYREVITWARDVFYPETK